jgi:hypothetical protein
MKLKGLAKLASDDWAATPAGWSAEWVRCTECGYTCVSVHPFGMRVMECGGCHAITRHEVIE